MSAPDGLRAGPSLSKLSATEWLVLVAVTFLGAALRVWYQHERSFSGDEVGTLVCMQESPAHILSNFGPWLSMNYFILLEKGLAAAFGPSPGVLTAVPLAAAVCTIPLIFVLASSFCSRRGALIAAALAAANAYLVEFSPVIRSYSLLVALTLATVILFLRWRERPTPGRGAACAAAATVLCLVHMVGIYVWAGLGLLAVASWVARVRAGTPAARILAEARDLGLPFLAGGVVLLLAYARLFAAIRTTNAEWTEPAPSSIDYLPFAFSTYFAIGRWGLAAGLFLALGTWAAIREERHLLVLWFLTLMPVCAMSLQGVTSTPWGHARFLMFTLPFLLVLVAAGIGQASRALAEPRRAWLAWGLTLLLILTWMPALRTRFARKRDMPWAEVARVLESLPPETEIVATSLRDNLQLRPLEMESGREVLTLSELLRAGARPGQAGLRVVYVNSFEPIQTEADSTRHGRIQVIAYEGDSLRRFVTRLHADLVRTTGERTAAELEPLYASLVESSEYLGLRDEAQKFRQLKGQSHQYKLRAQKLPGSQAESDPDR